MKEIKYRTPAELSAESKKKRIENDSFFRRMKKKKPKKLDEITHDLHEQAFDQFDCLECANCCSSISPIVTDKDIARLAKHLKMKTGKLIDEYLHRDADGDYVFNSTPCPFLMPDNYCMVYENRPKACREYPHTDRNKMYQILELTRKNCDYCPIVADVVDELKQKL